MTTKVAAAGDGARAPPASHPPRYTRKEHASLDWSFQTLRALPDLSGISHLTRHVRALNLSGNALLKLSGLEHLPALESLNVSGNRLVRLDVAQNVNLTHLDASRNSLMAIAGLGGCIRLAHLSLANNCISNVEGLDAQRSLETLDLSHNACEALGDISLCARLTHVNLSHNAVATLYGASALLPSALRVLNLECNELVDVAEMKHLAPCANLVSLTLRGNPLFAFAASCGFEPRAVVAFALPRLAALDGEGTSTATWAATARASLFRNDAGEPCPDLLRLLGEGHSNGLHGYLASAAPAAPFASGLWRPAEPGKSSLPATGAGFGPPGGSMYTTSSFVPVDLWSPGPSPAGSPAPASRRASDATDASLADGTSVSDASVDAREEHERSIARVRRGSRAGPGSSAKETGKSFPGRKTALAVITNAGPDADVRARAAESEARALRERLGREAAMREATERELSALRDEASRKRAPRVAAAAALEGTASPCAESYIFSAASARPEGRDDLSAPDLRVLALAAEQAEASSAAGTTDASPRDESAPRSAQGERLAAARAARAASRTPVPASPAEFSVSDASLSPSPIPVTLAARVAAAAAGASPLAGPLSSRTPIPISAPIPASPADGTTFDFSVSDASEVSRSLESSVPGGDAREDASADRGRAEASASFAGGADSEGTIGSSELGGLPGAESFLRDAAAQRAWELVVGLIASSADDETEDDSTVPEFRSVLENGARDESRAASDRSTGSRTTVFEESSLGDRSGDADGSSSLATLPGAEQWLRSAETERRHARREEKRAASRDRVDGSAPGSGNVSSGGESASRLGRFSGASALSGSDRSGSLDTLPGADEWLKSPGARGALDAYAREGVRAPFEDRARSDAEGDAESETAHGTDRGLGATPSELDVAAARSVSPSPPPPSDRQLADELRQKINRLRVAARRSDDVVATVRGPSPLSRMTGAADASGVERAGSTPDLSGSSSLDPTTVSVAKSEVEVAYERFAGVMRADRDAGRRGDAPRRSIDAPVSHDTTADDSFRDAPEATALSRTSFASAAEGASAFDADALVSSTFDDVFGDGDGSRDGSESGGGDDAGDESGNGSAGDIGDDAGGGDDDAGAVAVTDATPP